MSRPENTINALRDGKASPANEIAERIISVFPGKNQKEIAALIGKRQQTVSGWLNGKSSPTLKQLVEFSEKSGKTLDWFVFGERKTASTNAPVTALHPPPDDCPNGGLCALFQMLFARLAEKLSRAADHSAREEMVGDLLAMQEMLAARQAARKQGQA